MKLEEDYLLVDSTKDPIDELIAYPLAILNNKGYITEFSCSGHKFIATSYLESEKTINPDSKIIFSEYAKEYDSICIYEYLPSDEMYVLFEKEHNFKSLPDHWKLDGKKLFVKINSSLGHFNFYRNIIDEAEKLTIWANDLPAI